MKKTYLTVPNFITFLRLIASVVLLFIEPLSFRFIIIYTFAGISDVIDGFLARKLKLVSKFGSMLDSVSDLVFYTVMMIKILPTLFKRLNPVIWNWVFGVLLFRIVLYLSVAIKKHHFLSSHNLLNKVTGLNMFFLPYWTFTNYLTFFSWLIIVVAIVAAIYEFIMVIKKDAEASLD